MKITGVTLQKLLKLEVNHALYRKDGGWYHNLQKFPGVLFDENGYVIFKDEKDYVNNPGLRIRQDLNVPGGIENLPNYHPFTQHERLLIYGENPFDLSPDQEREEDTVRVLREINMILRKKKHVDKLKNLYNNRCQLCGIQISIGKKKYYSEVHHIIPLGNPHNGKDVLSNMICVCPNHHVQLDLNAIPLNPSEFVVDKHPLSQECLSYHNRLVTGIEEN